MTSPFPDTVVNTDQPEKTSPIRSVPKAGQRHNLSESYLRKQIKAGAGPVTIRLGKRDFVDDAAMDSWIASKRSA